MVGHVFKVTLYKKLLGMISRYTLNEIATEYEHVPYAGKNPSRCACVMRTTHDLPCAYELSKYVVGSIPLETIHIFWCFYSLQQVSIQSLSFLLPIGVFSSSFGALNCENVLIFVGQFWFVFMLDFLS